MFLHSLPVAQKKGHRDCKIPTREISSCIIHITNAKKLSVFMNEVLVNCLKLLVVTLFLSKCLEKLVQGTIFSGTSIYIYRERERAPQVSHKLISLLCALELTILVD